MVGLPDDPARPRRGGRRAPSRRSSRPRKPYLVIARDLAPEQSEAIETRRAPPGIDGISFESDSIRSYPQAGGGPNSTLAAHLIGFVNREGEGQYGVEQFYQDVLAGEPKVVEADRDAIGKPITETERTVEPGVPGEDIRLTIDAGLQLALEQEVMAARIANGARVRLCGRDGSLDRRDLRRGDATRRTTPTTTPRSPATTRRAFIDPVVSRGLRAGLGVQDVHRHRRPRAGHDLACRPDLQRHRPAAARRRQGPDQRRGRQGDGQDDARGRDRLLAQRRRREGRARASRRRRATPRRSSTRSGRGSGFGSPTGIDVAGEVRGLVNDPAITAWREIDLANGSFGQGVAVTQIQLAAAYAAMVNGGVLVQPHVVAGIGAAAGQPRTDGRRVLDPALSPHARRRSWSTCWRARGTPTSRSVPGLLGRRQDRHRAGLGRRRHKRWARTRSTSRASGSSAAQEGHPDLIVAVRIEEARPGRNARGQLVLPINSTELFRRVATDAVTTPGLLPVLDPRTTTRGDR